MNAARDAERHLELKVGAIILIALALLVAFVLILGDFSFNKRESFDVHFQNPGGLSPGAAVKVSGRRVGRILEMTYMGHDGPLEPSTEQPAFIRARVEIDADIIESLRGDVRFYITTKGVLGDPYLEIDPGVSKEPFDPKQPAFGVDPPRLDLFLADAAQLVDGLNKLLERNTENIDSLLGSSARLLAAVDGLVNQAENDSDGSGNRRFDRIMDGFESLLSETEGLVSGAKKQYVDDPSIKRTIRNFETLSATLNRDVGPLMVEIKEALAVLDRLGDAIGPKEAASLREALGRLDSIAKRADRTLADVEKVVGDVRAGKGTVGQLLDDQEIYDDIKELIRDIKRHPWKLIWED